MLIEKITGGYAVSDIIDGYISTRRYFGYTKREAVRMFKEEVK